jgi:predicted ATPase/DNA-binding winged helix-turn-helix (wHTH) protein
MGEQSTSSAERAASFGPFRLLPTQQLLLEGDNPIRLGSRALEILIVLVERAGELVSKSELMARVWPNTVVEENNLRVNVAALRRTLGDGQPGRRYLTTIPGRGYRFVAPVEFLKPDKPQVRSSAGVERTHNLPAPLTRTLGRVDAISALLTELPGRRLITIVGAGGIGKTTVALSVAEALIAAYEHGIRFVDLAPLRDSHLLPSAVASALGLAIHSDNEVQGLITYLQDKRMLLVLDSCEHVIETAAVLAERILNGAPGVHVVATSREPLHVKGERVHRLSPLELPTKSSERTASEVLAFPSVQLFVERAAATLDGFELDDADAPVVAEICRKLEGMPLAIELAATRIDAFGLRELSVLLDDRIRLLKYGRRTALPRHQTLTAALDWSHEFLPKQERVLLRRLSVFCSAFTLVSARALGAAAEFDVVEGLENLVAKSLVSADVMGAVVQYRLLATTRAYAMQKLIESGEFEEYVRRHAEHHRDVFERTEAEWEARPIAELLNDYGGRIDDVRSALNWAYSPGGDAAIGAALTAAAVPLWMHLSLLDECRNRVERALAALSPGANQDARAEMKLHAGLGTSLIYTRGSMGYEVGAAWTRTFDIAESLNDTEYQLRALWGLWSLEIGSGQFRASLALAQRFYGLATRRGDANDQLVGDRLIGTSQHYLGDLTCARRHIERVLTDYVASDDRSHIFRFQLDLRVTARVFLARILWLQGFPDQAIRTAHSAVEEAREPNHVISLCYALAMSACLIASWVGELAAAEHYVGMLLDYSTKYALADWHACGRCHQGLLAIKRGDLSTGLPLLRAGFGELRHAMRYNMFLGALGAALGEAGRVSEGLVAIDEAIDHSEGTEERWAIAELLREKGELVLLQSALEAESVAEDHFRRALDLARRQGTLSWELRAAKSLARLLRDQGRFADALACLQPVYDRFTEGFHTADLVAARALIEALASSEAR